MTGFYSTDQTASELGLSRIRIYQMIKEGKIKTDFIAYRHLIRQEELDRLKEERTAKVKK